MTDSTKRTDVSFFTFFRALAGLESGRWCRSCGEAIRRDDRFGASEGVCPACRASAA
jgi:hypothetical protein